MALESAETPEAEVQVFEFEKFRADLRTRTLVCGGQRVTITSKVFDTLALLLQKHGQVVDKDQLIRALWPDTVVEESNLHHYVSTVRKVLGEKPGEHRFIATVPGRGYSFVAPIRLVPLKPDVVSRVPRRHLVLGVCGLFVAMLIVAIQSFAHRTHSGGRSTKPLTASLGVADMASFSPDGKEVVFSWRGDGESQFHLYTKDAGTESIRQITSGPVADIAPAWSPDGLHVAFVRNVAGRDTASYCLVPARGGSVTTLASAFMWSGKTTKIAWTRDGEHLIVAGKGTNDQPSRLSLLSLDGKEQRLLTFAAEQWGDDAPAVSPDGKRLAFTRVGGSGVELRVMPAMGGESTIIVAQDRDVGSSGIAWTPDSRGIVYHSSQGGLWKVPLNGGDPERLGIGSDNANYPAISASGHLAFTEPARNVTLINAVAPAPGQPVAVRELFSSTRTVFDPQWSPDGKQIAFYSTRSGATEIWCSNPDGTDLLRLTSFGGPHTRDPRWSPDGTTIAFDSRSAGTADLYVISAKGGVARRMTPEAAADITPAWSNEGDTIYFSSNRSGTNQIWRMPAAGGSASQVTSDGGVFPAVSSDGYLYFLKAWSVTNLWRMPLDGGQAEVVISGSMRAPRLWAPTAGGVYYIDRNTALQYFDTHSRRHSGPLLQLTYPEITVESAIGVSRDGRSVLIPKVRESGTDIMLVEKFW